MCSVGWAGEDPGRWSMTWYGTRYLFLKIFCLQNKSNVDSSNARFSTFTSSAVQVWAILPEKDPLYTVKRKWTVLVFCLFAASSSKVIEAWTLHFKTHGMCSLQVCHEVSAPWTASLHSKPEVKSCALWLSASSLGNILLLLLAGLTWGVEICSLQVCTVLC